RSRPWTIRCATFVVWVMGSPWFGLVSVGISGLYEDRAAATARSCGDYLNDRSQNHDHFSLGLIRLHDTVRLPDVLEAEHAGRLRFVIDCLHVGRDGLGVHV